MKRIVFTLSILVLFSSTLYSQKIEDVGAGVIDFLLRNPKTANKMNTTETVALDIIGDLLKTESERKHQLEYASAGRNQVTINSNDGRQAQFVKSETGKVFLLVDGVIYPIATELVNQAKGNENKTSNNYSTNINPYDLEDLKNKYYQSEYYSHKIMCFFTYKWHKDFDNDGVGFDEYHQIKNLFYDNENFKVAVDIDVDSTCFLELEVYNDYNGEKVFFLRNYIGKSGSSLEFFNISAGSLPIGIHLINVKLIDNSTGEKYSSMQGKIQIIEGNSNTKEVSYNEKNYRNRISYSCPKNIFFCTSWKDKNNNGRYDFDEFSGLNKTSYSLSKDSLHVSINFPEKSGEIIIQSWTKNGKLLGTTTKPYQQIITNWIFPGSNPYDSMDFIDMVKINGVGEYKITVDFVEGGHYEKELIITE